MPRISFSLRDVFWFMLVAGIGCAWTLDHRHASHVNTENEELRKGVQFLVDQYYLDTGREIQIDSGKGWSFRSAYPIAK